MRISKHCTGSLCVALTLAALAPLPARGAELPEDRAELMYQSFDGGGLTIEGPALLVRKRVHRRVSLNASYDVEVIADRTPEAQQSGSPFRDRRRTEGAGFDVLARDARVAFAVARSRESDFAGDTGSLDVAQEFFGGQSTLDLGYSRGFDKVYKIGLVGPVGAVTRGRYRLGLTQILSPRWWVSLHGEALFDEGDLAGPYRVARVFGAAVPERVPDERSARAFTARTMANLGPGTAVRAEFRYYRDTWRISASTLELGARAELPAAVLMDLYVRAHTQSAALFYSDNAQADTEFVSRNRQWSSFRSGGPGITLGWTAARWPQGAALRLSGRIERLRYAYSDFTDLATGRPYNFNATLLNVSLAATY